MIFGSTECHCCWSGWILWSLLGCSSHPLSQFPSHLLSPLNLFTPSPLNLRIELLTIKFVFEVRRDAQISKCTFDHDDWHFFALNADVLDNDMVDGWHAASRRAVSTCLTGTTSNFHDPIRNRTQQAEHSRVLCPFFMPTRRGKPSRTWDTRYILCKAVLRCPHEVSSEHRPRVGGCVGGFGQSKGQTCLKSSHTSAFRTTSNPSLPFQVQHSIHRLL